MLRLGAVPISDSKNKQAQKTGPVIGPPRQNTYSCVPRKRDWFLKYQTPKTCTLGCPEAATAWQWFNWTVTQIPFGKRPLLLNMVETVCRLFYESKPGILATRVHHHHHRHHHHLHHHHYHHHYHHYSGAVPTAVVGCGVLSKLSSRFWPPFFVYAYDQQMGPACVVYP